MKVYEVISKDPQLDEFSLNPMNWFGAGNAGAAAKQASYDDGAVKNLAAIAKKQFPNLSPAAGKALADITSGTAKASKAASQEAFAMKVGNISYVLRVLGAFAISYKLYSNFSILEDKYNAGELNAEQYKEAHEAYWGLWVIQFMGPWLATTLGTAKLVAFLIRLILAVLTLGVTVFTGGGAAAATITGLVVEQAVFTALQAFLMSKTFEQWMSYHFFKTLVTIGSVPDASWNILRQYLSEIPVINAFFKDKGVDFYTAAKKEKQRINPAAAADDEKATQARNLAPLDSDKNAIMINGIRVTDKDGNLDDYAMMRPFVKNYLELHPEDPNVQKVLALQSKSK